MLDAVDSVWHFWWLVFPLGGALGGVVRSVAAANERRADRRMERYRLKQQAKIAAAQAAGRDRDNTDAQRRELRRIMALHNATDERWFGYETDIAKLLDFPMMTDMRDPLTVGFHKARQRAELLRPERIDDVIGDRDAQLAFRDAVTEYVTAFDVAEAEAIRRRRSDFSADEQQRIGRAQHLLQLAEDRSATAQERQGAYARARKELDGLIVLPTATRIAIERRVAGEIEA